VALLVLTTTLGVGGLAWWHSARTREVLAPPLPAEEQRLLRAAAAAPESAAARVALGQYYLRSGQPFEALWELEQARAMAPRDRAARVDLATALAMARLYPEAEAELDAAIALPPTSRAGHGDLAALLLATGQPEAALAALRKAPDQESWLQGQLLLARAHEALGQLPEARQAYARYAALARDPADGAFRLGRFLLASGQPGAARLVLTTALRRSPREARLLLLLAVSYGSRGGEQEQPDRQGELLTAALQQPEAKAVPAHLAMGALYLRHRRYREGGAQLEPLAETADLPQAHRGVAVALDGTGKRAEAAYHRGMAAVVEGNADVALKEFRTLARLAPADARAPQLISQCYAQMNRLDEALRAAEALYRQGARPPELFERLATLFLLTYNRRAARHLCEEWQRTQPDSGRPLGYLGRISLADLKLKEATEEYEAAVAREPRNVEHLLGLADALTHQPSPENSRRALELLRRAAAAAPQDARPHYQLGAGLVQAGQWEAARRELLRALDEDPTLAPAANNLLQIATMLRQPALAARFGALVRDLQERKRENDAAWKRRWEHPDDPWACYDLAQVLLRSGGLTDAEHQLERAAALRPGPPEAARLLQRVRRLLDGIDPDGRRLVSLPGEAFTTETRRAQRGRGGA
jgi:Flp pilus assembly protein TadD